MSIKVKVDEIALLKKRYQEEGKKALVELAVEVLKEYPEYTNIRWVQHVPYFNDGDPCEFTLGEITMSNLEEGELDDYSPWGDFEGEEEREDVKFFNPPYDEGNSFRTFIRFINEHSDLSEETFGSHADIAIFSNGRIIKRDYDPEY